MNRTAVQAALANASLCFYCGVDSKTTKIFLFGLIGSLVFGTIFAGFGLLLKGRFRNSEDLKFEVLEVEKETL